MALTPNSINGQALMNGHSNDDDNEELAALWSRYDEVKMLDVTKNVLLEDLLGRYEYLKQKHFDYVREHRRPGENSAGSNAREQMLEGSVKQLQRILNRDPFIVVLIDGDDLIFNDELICAGQDGGKKAAALFQQSVALWARSSILECPADVKVVVRIYAHLHGLTSALTAGKDNNLVKDFFRGFTTSQPLFDFVDVEHDKDGTYFKVAEQFRLHIYNYQCRHVLFAPSSLNGKYTTFMKTYAADDEATHRVTLLQGIPLANETPFSQFPRQTFPDVFRNAPLVANGAVESRVRALGAGPLDTTNRRTPLNATTAAFSPTSPLAYTPLCSPMSNVVQVDKNDTSIRGTHLRSDSVASNITIGSDGNKNSWATVTRARASLPLTDASPKLPGPYAPPSIISRNRRGQRLDPTLEYDRDAVQRLKKLKLCNQFYIGIGCCHHAAGKADKCPHRHDLTLSSLEKHNLRVVARETPCKRGTHCDDPKCIYGHACPFPVAGEGSLRETCLNGELCRFPRDMHAMDTAPVKYVRVTGAF